MDDDRFILSGNANMIISSVSASTVFNGFLLMVNSFCIDIVPVHRIHKVVCLDRVHHSMDTDIWA